MARQLRRPARFRRKPIRCYNSLVERFQPPLRAPSWPSSARWVNAPESPTLFSSTSRPRLIVFWNFTCLSCLRALPYWRAWHERYESIGLEMVGVHTPEYDFGQDPQIVARAAARLGLRWPILLDSDQTVWTAFANKAWPAIYLLDAEGRIRVRQIGEGHCQAVEREIQTLLRDLHPAWEPPELLDPVRAEDRPGAACLPATQDLHDEALGNGPVQLMRPANLSLPGYRREGHFYLQGTWQRKGDGLQLVSAPGHVVVPFMGTDLHAILGTLAALEARQVSHQPFTRVVLYLDGEPLSPDLYGEDALMHKGKPTARIDTPRLYTLMRRAVHGLHEFEIRANDPGLVVYGFSFESCLASAKPTPQPQEV